MSEPEALPWQTLSALSERIRARELSPITLIEHLLERIERIDPDLGAFRLVAREQALKLAQAAELALDAGDYRGPLHGIPFAAKDIIDVAGMVTTAGSSALANNVVTRDAHVIRRLRQAGMILIGKTQTVQFAMGAPGINHDHGTPHNPWSEVPCCPGGSSSGSAVAVAAGMVPMAIGTDTGGSVRIPAALCGTVGLKTTVGQISRAGVFPLSHTFDSVGPLTRGVEDAALTYCAMVGRDPNDPSTASADLGHVMESLYSGVEGVRIGIAEGVMWEALQPEVEGAVRGAGDLLDDLGAQVRTFELPEASEALAANPRRIISSIEGCRAHERMLGPDFDGYDRALAQRIADGRKASGVDYLRAIEDVTAIAARARHRLEDLDVFIAPTTSHTTRPLTEVDADPDTYNTWNQRYARNTSIANLLGLCALSVPCGLDEQRRPIGLMIHANAGCEAMALRVGLAFERSTQWHRSRPELGWITGG